MSNTIRIKRRASGGGNAAGAPSSLKNGELAYNEVDDILYYGYGVSGGDAASIPGIAGSGAYVNRTTAQTVAGIKTFTNLLKPDGGINVNSGKFSVVAASGNTTVGGIFGVVGRADIAGVLNADGGIAVDTDKFTVADTSGNVKTKGTLEVDGNTVLNGGLDFGGTVPAATAAEGDIVVIHAGEVKTKSNANVLTAIGGAPAAGSVNITTLGTITTGTWAATDIAVAHGGTGASTAAAAATNLGLGTGNSPTFTNLTLSGALNANGGITTTSGNLELNSHTGLVDIDDAVDISGQVDISGALAAGLTLSVGGITTLSGLLNANAGIAVDTNKFTVADSTGNVVTAGTLSVGTDKFIVNSLGVVSTGSWHGTDIGVAHGGTGASSAAAAATNLGLGTGNSPEFVQVTVSGSGGFVGSGAGLTSIPAANLTGNISKDRLPVATSSARGAIELFSDTAQTVAANTVSTTASRTYGIQLNSAGQAVVNVPWSDSSSSTRASLNIDTDDDVVFKNLELGGASGSATIKGPAELKIDPAAHGDATGTVVISGNLQVDGTTTTVNSTIVEIDDLALDLASEKTSLALIDGAGIRLGDDGNSPKGGLVEFVYSHSNTRMELSSALHVNGGLKASSLVGCTIDGGAF